MSGILWQKADRPSNASSCFIIPSDAFNAFENIVGNGENAGNPFSHKIFNTIKHRNLNFNLISFVFCKYFEFGPVQKDYCLVKG